MKVYLLATQRSGFRTPRYHRIEASDLQGAINKFIIQRLDALTHGDQSLHGDIVGVREFQQYPHDIATAHSQNIVEVLTNRLTLTSAKEELTQAAESYKHIDLCVDHQDYADHVTYALELFATALRDEATLSFTFSANDDYKIIIIERFVSEHFSYSTTVPIDHLDLGNSSGPKGFANLLCGIRNAVVALG